MLRCSICNTDVKWLGRHISRTHHLTEAEYLMQFPGSVLWPTPKCVSCGIVLAGYQGSAANVKCEGCRKTRIARRKGGDTDGMVACRLCHVQMRSLINHLLRTHKVLVSEYLEAFPDAPIEVAGIRERDADFGARVSTAVRRFWGTATEAAHERARKNAQRPRKGYTMSEARKQAISEATTGVPKTLTDEDRKGSAARLAKVREDPANPAKLAAGVHRRIARGDLVGLLDPETRAKSLASRIRNGTLIPPGGGRGITGFRKGISHYCRSTLEANFARVLTHEGVPYENEPEMHRLPDGKHYTPDFRLACGFGAVPAGWVELKGWRKKDGTVATEEKIRAFEALTGSTVFVLTMHDPLWAEIETRYAPIVAVGWETPRCNLRTHPSVFAPEALEPTDVFALFG